MDVIYLRLYNAQTTLTQLDAEQENLAQQIASQSKHVQNPPDCYSYCQLQREIDKLARLKAKLSYVDRLVYHKQREINKRMQDNPGTDSQTFF